MAPNPANNYVTVNVFVDENIQATFTLIDKLGRKVHTQNEKLTKGSNNITLYLDKFSDGVYAMVFENASEKIVKQLIIIN